MVFKKIKLAEILPSNNRNEGGMGDIAALANNIREFGQISPVVLRECEVAGDDGAACTRYTPIAGRRRIAAFRELSAKNPAFDEISAIVYEALEDAGNDELLALAENTARESMNPIDEGVVFSKRS